EQRRFAGARRPHDRHELAFLDVQAHATEHVGASDAVRVRLLDVAQRDQHVQSARQATRGSTRVARPAGRRAAAATTIINSTQTPTKVGGSKALTPNS